MTARPERCHGCLSKHLFFHKNNSAQDKIELYSLKMITVFNFVFSQKPLSFMLKRVVFVKRVGVFVEMRSSSGKEVFSMKSYVSTKRTKFSLVLHKNRLKFNIKDRSSNQGLPKPICCEHF